LINDILDLSRVESGHQHLNEKNIPVKTIVDEVMTLVSRYPNADKKHFSVALETKAESLFADERIVKQILLNLLSNAIKFTHDDGQISLRVFDFRKQLAFEVEDNGIGIAADKIDGLFSPFTQVENIFTRAHAGSGLGLSLVKHLIELHGGKVEMKSEEGQGTRVTVYFPQSRIILSEKSETKKITTKSSKEKKTKPGKKSVKKEDKV